jgi:hypothetical protein
MQLEPAKKHENSSNQKQQQNKNKLNLYLHFIEQAEYTRQKPAERKIISMLSGLCESEPTVWTKFRLIAVIV